MVRVSVHREKAPAARSFPASAPIPRALLDETSQEAANPFDLTEDLQTEVAMLMGTRAVDFCFLQRRGQSTNVRAVLGEAHRGNPVPAISIWLGKVQ